MLRLGVNFFKKQKGEKMKILSFLVVTCLFSTKAEAPNGKPEVYFSAYYTPQVAYFKPRIIKKILTEEDILRYGEELGFFDPYLLVAIAKVESSLQPKATSSYKGTEYYGLMQMCYETALMLGFSGEPDELLHWKTNVRLAARYLDRLYNQHGSKKKAVAAYNAGTVYISKKDNTKFVNQVYVDKVHTAYEETRGIGFEFKENKSESETDLQNVSEENSGA